MRKYSKFYIAVLDTSAPSFVHVNHIVHQTSNLTETEAINFILMTFQNLGRYEFPRDRKKICIHYILSIMSYPIKILTFLLKTYEMEIKIRVKLIYSVQKLLFSPFFSALNIY